MSFSNPQILYVDNHVLVMNKPAGMLTQPNHTQDSSLELWGKKWLKEKYHKPGNVFLEAIHRLDRPVSGIVLFARTSKALSRLQALNRSSSFQKHYVALVEGGVKEEEGELEHYLCRSSFYNTVVSKYNSKAKRCLLKFRALKVMDRYTLLKISLITGRYHQIRTQLSTVGHPIVGDSKYGSRSILKQLFLHHAHFSSPHPTTHQLLSWQASLPDHWLQFVDDASLCGVF